MKLQLERSDAMPLYLQIVNQISAQILAGELPPGYRLPPERRLAESLNVNRSTILNAYRELKARELIDSHVGKGTVVLAAVENSGSSYGQQEGQKPIWNHLFSEYSDRSSGHVINDLLSLVNRSDVISFATGITSPDCGPAEALAEIEKELLDEHSYQLLLHSPVEGFASLRKALAAYMEQKGCFCRPEEVMLLSGSQQGIDLAARVFVDPGDIVFVEEPTFFPALNVFRLAGARIVGVPMDRDGIRTDILESLLRRYHPKLLYTMPSFHNPTGIEMSLERRKHLLELVAKYRIPVLEDDAYGDLCYEGAPLPTLKSMDHSGYILYLNTFSKTIYPGLRIGWLAADKKVINRFAGIRQLVDLHTNCLSQQIMERYLTRGLMEAHLKRLCKEYRERRDLMYQALQTYAPEGLLFDKPRGGYYIWCCLPEGISETELVKKVAEHRVVFLPGTPSFPAAPEKGHMRLNFTFAAKTEIDRGIRHLCMAAAELKAAVQQNEEERPIDLNPIV